MSWTFAFLTDTHVGQATQPGVHNAGTGDLVPDRLDRLGPALADCEFVIHGGDVVEHGTAAEMAQAAALLRRWPCPGHLCLGNHDAQEPGARERWLATWPEAFGGTLEARSFTHRGVHCVLLQSDWRDAAGAWQPYWVPAAGCVWALPQAQLEWLQADLAAHAALPTVVVNHPLALPLTARVTGDQDIHHPPRPESAAELLAILGRHPQVVLLLGGHAHAHQAERWGHLWHVACGALCEPPYEYRRVTIEPDSWRVSTCALPGPAATGEVLRPWVAGRAADRELRIDL